MNKNFFVCIKNKFALPRSFCKTSFKVDWLNEWQIIFSSKLVVVFTKGWSCVNNSCSIFC
eukprot:TRINITY_DN10749_c0_g1_i1.p4 TRINITY_DN10749_c0_g1~~TRINITY_DN10749_c0_g1_i1.p4  ORF type:complete len:60 (+),score=2.50 TRINITY_DN10749_c0_g1_i1:161-340(+)